MSKVIATWIVLSTLCLLAPAALAQTASERPSPGIAHHDAKPSAMLYECDEAAATLMTCKFTELNVWKPLRVIAVNDEQRRTCVVAAHNFVQKFRRAAGDEPTWVMTTGPYGVCGITRESRFVGSKQQDGTVLWTYIVQIKVANKSAQDGSLRCAELREFNDHYRGQSSEQRADCATVRFEPGCSSDEFPCLGDGPAVVH